ncbi:hypothetical protein M758_8G082500 [Ceratodon purpureus]|uniref:Secreted protein n=1 Tax=Ceratodon purpureus TaxID=3225 RepID=A0A8T0H0A7_CERPU|nr:hypothetical protein KC19_8G086900 [Ceratodon purpureus]KAG0608148.1 hypothetical protein M758_8G082500 [Ceratodon purpureus]
MTCTLLVCIVLAQFFLKNHLNTFIYCYVFTGAGGFQFMPRCGSSQRGHGFHSVQLSYLLCDGMLKCALTCHSQALGLNGNGLIILTRKSFLHFLQILIVGNE